jgi:protein SCO1/2
MPTNTEPTGAREPRGSPSTRAGASFGLALAGILVALLLLGTGGYLWLSQGQGGESSIGGPFSLVNGEGKPVTDRDFRGRYMLVYFGYTTCPDVCPTTLNEVADAMEKLGPRAERVQPIFISVDPQRDTPAVVKQYVAGFSPRLIGLTGTPDEVAKVAKAYRVYYAVHRTGTSPDEYTVDHSSVLYLMSPTGAFVAPIRADEAGDKMAADVEKLTS